MASPSLSSKQQRAIETLLRKWKKKLTWELLVQTIQKEFSIKTTRQTLCTYTAIKNEYDRKKLELRGVTSQVIRNISKSDLSLLEKIEHLEAENAIQKRQLDEQLRMIERIFANASDIPSLNLNQLVKPRSEER